ncbi:hypothetical protein [Enterococcus casseliflavus]|uniref:hypothetical protein n=1 Tax=Enterococcus TaxID=1350 RepID=UPI0022E4989B|nr:hypothetical protein [Enterococcus casseliflavus]MEB6088211.1 hypothetical protein [Enterococcus casseliflavus]MEB6148743.1 hypothetical protein [Enterococcus casseliflavus]MEB8401757.1 hypothetical protein [Enterococcus casseliflavus]
MKKRKIVIVLFAALLSGCGVIANDKQTSNDNVPLNTQINTPQNQREDSQSGNNDQDTADQTDEEKTNAELDQADKTGTLVSIDGERFEMELTNTSQIKGEDGEVYDMAESSEEKFSFVITTETEIKVILYDAQSQNSRIVEGSRADLQLERSANIYGQQVGDTFIATKVIVMQIN